MTGSERRLPSGYDRHKADLGNLSPYTLLARPPLNGWKVIAQLT